DPAFRHPALVGDPPHEPRELAVAQHLAAHHPARLERRPPDQAFLAVEEDLQRTAEAADDAVLAFAAEIGDEAFERDLAAERELRLLGVPEVGEEALRLARRFLHAVEERREA